MSSKEIAPVMDHSKGKTATLPQQSWVSQIGPRDVLLGRGSGPNKNPGNAFFRTVLKKYHGEYETTTELKKKRRIILDAIHDFTSQGGRFLQKVTIPSIDCSSAGCQSKEFKLVEGNVVILKTRQALRYLQQENDNIRKNSKYVEQKKASRSSRSKNEPKHFLQATTDTDASTESGVSKELLYNPRKSQDRSTLIERSATTGTQRQIRLPTFLNTPFLGATFPATRELQGQHSMPNLLGLGLVPGLRESLAGHSDIPEPRMINHTFYDSMRLRQQPLSNKSIQQPLRQHHLEAQSRASALLQSIRILDAQIARIRGQSQQPENHLHLQSKYVGKQGKSRLLSEVDQYK